MHPFDAIGPSGHFLHFISPNNHRFTSALTDCLYSNLSSSATVVLGRYRADPDTGSITFQHRGKGMKPTPLHRAPGYASSLMPLWHHLRFQAECGRTLLVEEAELMLQPEQQEALTGLMLRLAHHGVNAVITTSSPLIEDLAVDIAAADLAAQDGAKPAECAVYRFQDGYIEDITPEPRGQAAA